MSCELSAMSCGPEVWVSQLNELQNIGVGYTIPIPDS